MEQLLGTGVQDDVFILVLGLRGRASGIVGSGLSGRNLVFMYCCELLACLPY